MDFKFNLIEMRPMMDATTVEEAIEAFSKIIGIKLVPEEHCKSVERDFNILLNDFNMLLNNFNILSEKYENLRECVKPIKDIEL